MARYVKDLVLNKPEDFVTFIMNDYLQKNQFVVSEWKGEPAYRTGRIVDYLYYRGMKICYRVMERSQKKTYESDYRDGHGAFGNSGGRL